MFKIGDIVRCLADKSTNYKQLGVVTCVCEETIEVKYDNGELGKGKFKYYELATRNPINKIAGKIMNLRETFVRGLMSEPEKTFRKVGITNGDNLLTSEGTELFLNWLFQKNKTEFKTEVADPIVAEQKEEKK